MIRRFVMKTSEALIRLSRILTEVYMEAVGPRPAKKGMKKLKPQDQVRLFKKLAEHLREVRLTTMDESNRPPPCEPPFILCNLGGGLYECMTQYDCDHIRGGKPKPEARR
jgi:hypothetical protein